MEELNIELKTLKVIAQHIVYPGQGVCRYVKSDTKFNHFHSLLMKINIMVPVKDTKHRALITCESAQKLLKELDTEKAVSYGESWNRRKKSYLNRIYSGDIQNIVNVVKEINFISTKKALSTSEKEILKKAQEIACQEINFVLR